MAASEPFTMRKVLSIDEIKERCDAMGVDCIVSSDAPLVTALNARSHAALFGFAFTPLQIADMEQTAVVGTTPDTDLEASRLVMHITGLPLRFVHSTIRKIREIRRYTHEVKNYLTTNNERMVLEAYMQTRTLDTIMEKYGDTGLRPFFESRRTAVVDVSFFSSVDKRMLPDDAEFLDNAEAEGIPQGTFSIDTIYSIGNDRQIADCVVSLINRENCNDVAVVLDQDGPAAEAVRLALYRDGIPFKNELTVRDLASVRDYIQFLKFSLDYDTVRAGEVRELFNSYGTKRGGLSIRTDTYLLSRMTTELFSDPKEPDGTTIDLIGLMKDIYGGGVTYEQALDRLPHRNNRNWKGSIRILLRDMGILETAITPSGVSDIEYAVNNVDDLKHNEQVSEDERTGVLLADCRKSVYIDRSLVFFIGLDDSWRRSCAGKDYIRDPEKFDEDEAKRLRVLLQQGDTRIYIIRPSTDGKETLPCQSFETIAKIEGNVRRIGSFSDICPNIITGSWVPRETFRAAPATGPVPDTEWPSAVRFSKTDYNKLCDCPLKYMFHHVMYNEFEQNTRALFGSSIHEFAEFCYCYPELAEERFDVYVNRLLEDYSGISSTCLSEIDAGRFRTVMRNVMEYVRSVRPREVPLGVRNSSRDHPNTLISGESRTGDMCSADTECTNSSLEHPFDAQFDLRQVPCIYDWKTGKAKTPEDILCGFYEPGTKYLAEVQPMLYLKAMEENYPGREEYVFNLVYFGDDVVRMQIDQSHDVSGSIRRVVYRPGNLWDFLEASGAFDSCFEKRSRRDTHLAGLEDQVRDLTRRMADEDDWDDPEQIYRDLAELVGRPTKERTEKLKRLQEDLHTARVWFCTDDSAYVSRKFAEPFFEKMDGDAAAAKGYLEIPLFTKVRDHPICDYCEYKSSCFLTEDGTEGDE